MQRHAGPRVSWQRTLALLALGVATYLGLLGFGNAPEALGSEATWTEVMTWAFLHDVQWGRDLLFTYGPLGFLQPYTSYVAGSFALYTAGQLLLPAAFVLCASLLLARARSATVLLFAAAALVTLPLLPGDIAWALTLVFGTVFLLDRGRSLSSLAHAIATLGLACVFAVLALTKFSLFPLWAVCTALLGASALAARDRRGIVASLAFVVALPLAWIACGQALSNLPAYVTTSLDVSDGYRRAMGMRAPFAAETAGVVLTCAFVALCGHSAWRRRRRPDAAAPFVLAAVVALLFWLAFFTRGDHWPWFFAAYALLPFALLCCDVDAAIKERGSMRGFAATVVVAAAIACFAAPAPLRAPQVAWAKIRSAAGTLADLKTLAAARDSQWRSAAVESDLPGIRRRIGSARVDVLTWSQGIVLLNGFTYAPRPMFLSLDVFTTALARRNEAYFLGTSAPEFVMLRLDAVDERIAMSEDGLALLAILRRYRPVAFEKSFLLLQKDAAPAAPAALPPPQTTRTAEFGGDVAVAGDAGAIVYLHAELNWFGRLYTTLFREPVLRVELETEDGRVARHRVVRLTAALGFLLNPVIDTSRDWLRSYAGMALPHVRRLRLDTETRWERLLYRPTYDYAFRPFEMPRAGAIDPALMHDAFAGFNILPIGAEALRFVEEDQTDAIFLHAPATLAFAPRPGNYDIMATVGIDRRAPKDPNCTAVEPDGIGVSLVRSDGPVDTILQHLEIDPFHDPAQQGPQRLFADRVDIEAGARLELRVDPGNSGTDVRCDWGYARGFTLRRRGEVGAVQRHADAVFEDNFE